MYSEFIDLEILNTKNGNPFEIIMSRVENANLNFELGTIKTDIEKSVLLIERKIQDLEEENSTKSVKTIQEILDILNVIIPVIKIDNSLNTLKVINTILQNLNKIISPLKQTFHQVNFNFIPKFLGNFKGRKVSIVNYTETINKTLNKEIKKRERVFIQINDVEEKFYNPYKSNIWNIEIYISDEKQSNSIHLLGLFVDVLSTIKGVETEILKIEIGSIFSKIIAVFKTDKARDEAEEIIKSAKKYVKGGLEKDFVQNEKSRVEIEKINAEKNKIEDEITNSNSNEAIRKRKLEMEALEIENRKKNLEVENLEIELFIKKKKLLSELLAEKIISIEEFKLSINNALIIEKTPANKKI